MKKMNQNQKRIKKRCQWSSKDNAIANGGTYFIIELYPLSCWTRENDGRETPGKVTLWTLDARKCGLETPNAIMKTDARRLKNFSMDAGRLQKYPPGRQTPNLFHPPYQCKKNYIWTPSLFQNYSQSAFSEWLKLDLEFLPIKFILNKFQLNVIAA